MVNLSPEAWTAVGTIVAAISGGFSAIWVERTRRASKDAAAKASEAADLARPTGNGFAGHVTDSLKQLLDGQNELTRQVNVLGNRLAGHIEQHLQAEQSNSGGPR